MSDSLATARQLLAEAGECIRDGNPANAAWRIADALGLLAGSGSIADVQQLPGVGDFTGRGFRLERQAAPQALEQNPAPVRLLLSVVRDPADTSVPCPKCGADTGAPCATPEGSPLPESHVARQRNFRVLGRGGAAGVRR